jgi:hypothetical protein
VALAAPMTVVVTRRNPVHHVKLMRQRRAYTGRSGFSNGEEVGEVLRSSYIEKDVLRNSHPRGC